MLRPGGHALVAFHTRDAGSTPGAATTLSEWWGEQVSLTFWFLDPAAEVESLTAAGLTAVARLDRPAHPGVERESERTYLLVRRP